MGTTAKAERLPEDAVFQFRTEDEANAFRKCVSDAGLRWARPIYWHDDDKSFPKEVIGATCFFLRSKAHNVGVTAAHVIRYFQRAKAETPSLVCQLNLMRFDLEGAIIDVDDALDIATFRISESDLKSSFSEPFDVTVQWPAPDGVVKRRAPIQLVGYPENIRLINPPDRSAVFRAYGAFGLVEDFSEHEIWVVYDPKQSRGAPSLPPLGYNMSGCSGGPAIVHETRNGLHRWYPVGLIVGGTKATEGAAAEFDVIRIRRIDCIDPVDGCIRVSNAGWLPPS